MHCQYLLRESSVISLKFNLLLYIVCALRCLKTFILLFNIFWFIMLLKYCIYNWQNLSKTTFFGHLISPTCDDIEESTHSLELTTSSPAQALASSLSKSAKHPFSSPSRGLAFRIAVANASAKARQTKALKMRENSNLRHDAQ